jgi:hypothetical protein
LNSKENRSFSGCRPSSKPTFAYSQWIGTGGDSDHSPIFLEIVGGPIKPPSPFKYNPSWDLEESFHNLVKEGWEQWQEGGEVVAGVHFASNLKRVKQRVIIWEKDKRARDDRDLKETEEALQDFYDSEGEGFATPDSKEALMVLEKKKRQLLKDQEEMWRQKSRATWLNSGDENTKFFQDFANGRKIRNTIWKLSDSSGREVSSFKDLAQLGKSHFQNLFKDSNQTNMAEILCLALLFPRFVEEDDNRKLMEEVSEDELKVVLHSF